MLCSFKLGLRGGDRICLFFCFDFIFEVFGEGNLIFGMVGEGSGFVFLKKDFRSLLGNISVFKRSLGCVYLKV